jgi:hypothetical protein
VIGAGPYREERDERPREGDDQDTPYAVACRARTVGGEDKQGSQSGRLADQTEERHHDHGDDDGDDDEHALPQVGLGGVDS